MNCLCLRKISFLTMPAKQSSSQQCLLSKVAEEKHTKKFVKKGVELIGNPAPYINVGSCSMLPECFHPLFSNICPGVGREEQSWMGFAGSLTPVPIDCNRGFNQSAISPATERPALISLMQQRKN